MLFTAYSMIVTVGWIVTTIYLLINCSKISFLKNVAVSPAFIEPSVAIIIPVKDEEAEVEQALLSVSRLAYKNYRVIVINDRSTDKTAKILANVSSLNPRITVKTIVDLPAGWLGKNNAMYQGYLAANEEWLLFTDADIVYAQEALRKAMEYAVSRNLDHLTALPEITSKSSVFKSVMNTFAIMLEMKLKPWEVKNPKSRASMGVGAFNLVRRTAYEKAGTHKVISLRPDDDLKLGDRIKRAGLRQDVVYSEKELSIAWYNSVREFVNGLMKNTFSVSNYILGIALLTAVMTLFVFVLPIPIMLFAGGTGILLAAVILISQIVLMAYKPGTKAKWWHALIIPFAGLIMTYIIVVSAFRTLWQGGIHWRDTFYPLKELKQQR